MVHLIVLKTNSISILLTLCLLKIQVVTKKFIIRTFFYFLNATCDIINKFYVNEFANETERGWSQI